MTNDQSSRSGDPERSQTGAQLWLDVRNYFKLLFCNGIHLLSNKTSGLGNKVLPQQRTT